MHISSTLKGLALQIFEIQSTLHVLFDIPEPQSGHVRRFRLGSTRREIGQRGGFVLQEVASESFAYSDALHRPILLSLD